MITQRELRKLHRALDDVRDLKARLKAAKDEAETLAAPIRDGLLIEPRIKIEAGAYTVALNEHSKRSPKWKQIVIERLGEIVAKEVIEDTPPKITHEVCVTRKGEGREDAERRIVLGNGDADES